MLTTREIAVRNKESTQAVRDRARRKGEKPEIYGRTWLWTPEQARKLSPKSRGSK